MPSGKQHDKLTIYTVPVVVIGSTLATLEAPLIPAIACILAATSAHYFGGLFLSPDLDLKSTRPAQRWGKLQWIWMGYARLMKHRGLSHMPVIGTLTRVAWLALHCPFILAIWLLPSIALWILIGLETSAAVHYLSDRLWSWVKRISHH